VQRTELARIKAQIDATTDDKAKKGALSLSATYPTPPYPTPHVIYSSNIYIMLYVYTYISCCRLTGCK
jgi:hypothetical protein